MSSLERAHVLQRLKNILRPLVLLPPAFRYFSSAFENSLPPVSANSAPSFPLLRFLCMFLTLLAAKTRDLLPAVFGHMCRRKSFSPNHQDQIGTPKHVYINTCSFILNELSPCKRQQGVCRRFIIGQRLNACQINFHAH